MSADKIVIDAHSHIYPRWYLDLLAKRTEFPRVVREGDREYYVPVPGAENEIDSSFWSLEEKLEFMDREGIALSVVALSNPWLDVDLGESPLSLARRVNEEFGSYFDRSAGRIAGLGILPPCDLDQALTLVGEIAAHPFLFGVTTGFAVCGREPDSEELDPLWAALADSGVPIFLHPGKAVGAELMKSYGSVLPIGLGFPFETSVWMARMALSGVFARHPSLKVLFAHCGGTMPMLAGRLEAAFGAESSGDDVRARSPEGQYGNVYLDTIGFHPRAVAAAADMVGSERLVIGTDHPFPICDAQAMLRDARSLFDGEELGRVEAANATELFNLSPQGVELAR